MGELVHQGIDCAHSGCLASISWFGHPTDPTLAKVAVSGGWAVYEAQGWLCPHHAAPQFQQEEG